MSTKPRNETPPPSARKGLDRRLRVENFLQGAERLFAERGYGRTTMEDIARLAGYGTGTSYHYFESKESLYGELLERKMAAHLDHLREQHESQATPRGRIRALLHGKTGFFRRNRESMEIFVKESVPKPSLMDAALTPKARALLLDRCLALMRETIEAGIGSGDFGSADPDLAVAAISGLGNGVLLHSIRNVSRNGLVEAESFMATFVTRGLLATTRLRAP